MHPAGLQIIPSAALQHDHFVKWIYKALLPPPPPLFFSGKNIWAVVQILRAKLNKNWAQCPEKLTQIRLGENKLSQIGRVR